MTDPVATLRGELDALARAYQPGHHGRWSAARRSDLLDVALRALWERAGAPESMTLAALGGFGRRLQLPASDVDLLVLHDDVDPLDVRRVTDALLYPLWDGGFTVGHAVRTPHECLAAAGERLDAWTAMLDARALAGDETLLVRALAPVRALATDDPEGFARRLRDAAADRTERFGSCAQLLEPDLKEGSGGLRDVASLGWLQAAVGRPLEDAGLLGAHERAAVDAAEEFLVRARSATHLETGKRSDRLLLELQPDVARGMGFVDEPRLLATDGLMRALFAHARDVEAATHGAIARLLATPGTPVPALADADDVLEALAGLAERGEVASVDVLESVAAMDLPSRVVWTDRTRAAFVRILSAGPRGIGMIDGLDRLALLERYLPCWADVRCRPQRDPYHRFTVDAHLTAAAARMATILAGDGDPDDAVERQAVSDIAHPGALLIGALLHDIGKVGGGNHVPVGAEIARAQIVAMGLDAEDADLVAFMVAEHLLLPDTATRRDLTDENLLLDVAARIRTPERLATLYLLAKADASATGPAAWTPWRQALIRELVAKIQRVFERGDMGDELAGRLAARVERVRALLVEEPEADVDRFVLRMPRGYFLSVDAARAARHYRTIAPALGSHDVRSVSAPGSRAGTYEVLVVAVDRPGLLSWIAGALALGGISILSAQVFTTEDGAAVDLFEVEGAFDPEITEARWREFRSSLRRAIEGSISLERKVADKRRHYPPPKVRTPVTVHVDNEASEFSTVIEVGAPDRIGLLHDITRTFADLHLDVHLAKVATYDGRVVDAFYVRDALGRKLLDPAQLDEIERALRERVTPAV
ncbi:MAG: [protein-PII] uridylyltransferase family protein [Actinomycetota bacterium]